MRISDWSSDVCSSDLMLAASLVTAERLAGRDRQFCREFISSHVTEVAEALGAVESRHPASTAAEIYLALARIALHKLELEHQIIDPSAATTFKTALSHPRSGLRKDRKSTRLNSSH